MWLIHAAARAAGRYRRLVGCAELTEVSVRVCQSVSGCAHIGLGPVSDQIDQISEEGEQRA